MKTSQAGRRSLLFAWTEVSKGMAKAMVRLDATTQATRSPIQSNTNGPAAWTHSRGQVRPPHQRTCASSPPRRRRRAAAALDDQKVSPPRTGCRACVRDDARRTNTPRSSVRRLRPDAVAALLRFDRTNGARSLLIRQPLRRLLHPRYLPDMFDRRTTRASATAIAALLHSSAAAGDVPSPGSLNQHQEAR